MKGKTFCLDIFMTLSLEPGSAVAKGKKQIQEKYRGAKRAQRLSGKGEIAAEAPPPFAPPQTTSKLASLADYFFPFCPNSEPGAGLYGPELVWSFCVSQAYVWYQEPHRYSNNWANQSILLKMTDSEKQPKLCSIFIISILKSLVIPVIWLARGRVIRTTLL